MSLSDLIQKLFADTWPLSLSAFVPEIVICGTIVVLLLVRMCLPRLPMLGWYVALLGVAGALASMIPALWQTERATGAPTEIFGGMLVADSFAVVLRALLLLFTLLFITFVQLSGVPDDDDSTEFCTLVLGALLGMCLMVSANHMLIVFLGMEMASVPCYVLAGLLRHRRTSTEAALKYSVYGAAAAGVMLFGISLLVGVLGSAHLPTMAARLGELFACGGLTNDQSLLLMLAGLLVVAGVGFKLSAVPFHFWTPDVFEGAPAEVGAFLSVASKAAALALLVRLCFGLGTVNEAVERRYQDAHHQVAANVPGLEPRASSLKPQAALTAALRPVRNYMVGLLTLLAAVTCTFGNLAAYGQTNIKRLLAYSTIAHAGYLIMPIAAAVAAMNFDPAGASAAGADPAAAARFAIASMIVYIGIYVFMNFGAFAVVAFVRNASGSEAIADYAGLMRRSPGVAVCMALILFSLLGLPPLAGFVGKFAIFTALVWTKLYVLLVIGAANTVLSLFYYLGVVRVMVMQPEQPSRPAATIPLWSAAGAYCALVTLPLLVLFIRWDRLFDWGQAAASTLLR